LLGFIDAMPEGMVHSSEDADWLWLVPPDNSLDIQKIDAATTFGGNLYIAATYSDGNQYHFLDTERVKDWEAGIARTWMTPGGNVFVAGHLASLIRDSDDYTASSGPPAPGIGTNVVTIEGPVGIDYPVEVTTVDPDGLVNNQTLTAVELIAPVAKVEAARAVAEFQIITGVDDDGASNYIHGITANGTALLAGTVAYDSSPEMTGLRVMQAINARTSITGYSATTKYGSVQIFAPVGEAYNGVSLVVTAKGKCILYEGGFSVVSGSASAGVNKISSIKAGGVEILGASVDWTTSNANTAALLAAQIRAYASTPKYVAHNEGENVFVSPETIRSDDATTISLVIEADGNVVVDVNGVEPIVKQQYGSDFCVVIESFLPGAATAGDVRVGDVLQLADPVTLEPATGVVSYSRAWEAVCYRIVTRSGASLICSETAPIPTRHGGYTLPEFLKGREVAVRRDGIAGWDEVCHVENVGVRAVQKITVENANFWAGEQDGVYLLHHNIKHGTGI
jgi:hypothetical protein